MSTMTVVPTDHPMMKAWNTYIKSAEYANTLHWATTRPEYVEGNLWAAFERGWSAAQSYGPCDMP